MSFMTARRFIFTGRFCHNAFRKVCFATKPPFPHTVVLMPALSPTMTQGNLGKWRKAIGDKLTAGDVLADLETDKATMDFEYNDDDGYIAAFLQKEGASAIKVGTPLVVLAQRQEDVSALSSYRPDDPKSGDNISSEVQQKQETDIPSSPPVQDAKSSVSDSGASPKHDGRLIASPAARVLAKQKNVDLGSISGSGPAGRIILSDVKKSETFEAKLQQTSNIASASPITAAPPRSRMVPLTNMRRVIANRLSESKSTIPHYYLSCEISMDRVVKLRQVLNEKNESIKLSYNDFVIKAAAKALQAVPDVNSAWIEGQGIGQHDDADISVAVATPNGLITPIIFNSQTLGLAEISEKMKALATRAKNGQLKPQEYQGGTFTISNLGMYGSVQHFSAIINPPQAAILAVGSLEEKIVRAAEPGKFEVSQVMTFTLSCDHRVVDGAVGAEWMKEFKRFLEEPLNMML